jgi:hypothetical protein
MRTSKVCDQKALLTPSNKNNHLPQTRKIFESKEIFLKNFNKNTKYSIMTEGTNLDPGRDENKLGIVLEKWKETIVMLAVHVINITKNI